MPHADGLPFVSSQEGGGNSNILDVPSAQLERVSEHHKIYILSKGGLGREHAAPDVVARFFIRERELYHEMQAACKGLIEVCPPVGREHRYAFILLHLLEEIADFDVGIAIVGIFDLGTLAKQGIRLVKKEDGITGLGFAEDPVEVLLSFPDILTDDLRQVDLVEVE